MKNLINRTLPLLCLLALVLALATGCSAAASDTDAVYPQSASDDAQSTVVTSDTEQADEADTAQTSSAPADSAESEEVSSDAVVETASTTETASSSTSSAEDSALEIALQDAGVTRDEISNLTVKLDQDDSDGPEYDISFWVGSTEYDYEIDADTLEIRSKELEQTATSTSNEVVITEAQATEIALQHAGCTEAEVSRLQVKLDKDDGLQIYEVEFQKDRTEYEYDIDASTGDILSYDVDAN